MSKNARKPCKVKNGSFIEPCKVLAASIETNQFGRSKGVVEHNYINVSTGKPTRRFYGMRSGSFGGAGICFNHCPFCGTDISAPFQSHEAPRALKRRAA